jgi:histidyl-tRNA synthetase
MWAPPSLTSRQAEYLYKVKPRSDAQWSTLERDAIPIAVFVGSREWTEGKVRIKEQLGKDAGKAQGDGDEVALLDLAADVKRRLLSMKRL